ncbi:hypothetical protein MUP38_02935 [Candidatus Bathyarchaeota archaeon]|nr:hypothetical protein [Candidatus Bathyarchaeota archaeon]
MDFTLKKGDPVVAWAENSHVIIEKKPYSSSFSNPNLLMYMCALHSFE